MSSFLGGRRTARLWLTACAGLLAITGAMVQATDNTVAPVYVFTSFRGNGEDGLHLAWSEDGYHWTALNGNHSLLKPEIGGYKLMRDPCVAQGPDGAFHLVWTTGWSADKGNVIGYAHSRDLIHWSAQRAIPMMENEPKTRNITIMV